MNGYFVAASLLAFIVGAVHSVLGEHLIFRRMREDGIIPTKGGELLRERHVRILWASWHLVTVMGCGMAALLLWLAMPASKPLINSIIPLVILISMLVSALLVLVGTRGRHPGWIGLLLVATCIFAGMLA